MHLKLYDWILFNFLNTNHCPETLGLILENYIGSLPPDTYYDQIVFAKFGQIIEHFEWILFKFNMYCQMINKSLSRFFRTYSWKLY